VSTKEPSHFRAGSVSKTAITNIIIVLIGIAVLCIGYAFVAEVSENMQLRMEEGYIQVQTPTVMLAAIALIFIMGIFLVIYPALCQRKGISCVRF